MLFALVALLVVTGSAELVLRFVFGLGNPVLIQPDSACAYIEKPDQNVYRFFCHTRTNRYGMRSDEIASTPAPGVLRIMFVGDSITYGTGRVDQKNIFAEIVRRDLQAQLHRPVEALNASASAWAIDNEFSYVRSRGIFGSKLVMLVLNSGDLTQRRATMAEVGQDNLVVRPATALGELWSRYFRPRLARRFGDLRGAVHVDAGDTVTQNAERTVQDNLEELDAFNSFVTARGARFLIVYAPFRRDIPKVSAQSLASLDDWSARHHVPLLDLTASEAAYPIREISLDGGVHFNVRGNQVVAERIEDWLEHSELRGL